MTNKGDSNEEEQAHEAGYDAFMTAMVFLRLCYKLDDDLVAEAPLNWESEKLKPVWNNVNLVRSRDNFHLGSDQTEVEAPKNVFHIFNFDKKTRTQDIFHWFAKYGKVMVNWKDDTSAFVTVQEFTGVEALNAAMRKGSDKRYQIETLGDLRDRETAAKQADNGTVFLLLLLFLS